MFALNIPSDEELTTLAIERRDNQMAALNYPGAFLTISLESWLRAIEHANVPYIPADRVATLDRALWENYDKPSADDRDRIDHFYQSVCDARTEHHRAMLRWDFCASLELKHLMSMPDGTRGSALEDSKAELSLDDPRAFELLYDYPFESVPVLARPWEHAKMVAGFPVEFRVFVRESKIHGIASYYPQRALPDSDEVREYVDRVRQSAEAIIAHLLDSGTYPWMMGYEVAFQRGSVNATMDFLIDLSGEARFLEAGPADGFGAHPCAFLGRPVIEGVALKLIDGVKLR